MIETMEESPDTVITLNTDRKFVVKESIEEIIKKVIIYNQKIFLDKTRIE
jgi:flagellar protein FlbD